MAKGSSAIIEDASDIDHWLNQSSDFLIIFDVHLDWTGRCEALVPQLDALYRTIDQSEKRWKVLSIEGPKFASKLASTLELSPNCNIESLDSLIKKTTCSPLFLAVKDRKVLSIIQGVNFPEISKTIQEHIPIIVDEEVIEDE